MSFREISSLIEKTSHWDKDERYMATHDLCNILGKEINLDENMEKKMCSAILKQLDDQSNDVQSVAMKCLAIMIKKFHSVQIVEIFQRISELILTGSPNLRDIYSLGLKTLLSDVSYSNGQMAIDLIEPTILKGLGAKTGDDIIKEFLEIQTCVLDKYGNSMLSFHGTIAEKVLSLLESGNSLIRKRSSNCIGSLSVVSKDELLDEIITKILYSVTSSNSLISPTETPKRVTLIKTLGTISRKAGHRLGNHIGPIIEIFLKFCGDPDDESLQTQQFDELRETCFFGLESFIFRCRDEVSTNIKSILDISLKFIRYDPNYSYEEEDDNNYSFQSDGNDNLMNITDEDQEDEFDEDYEEYSGNEEEEDDDSSWKVRKASIRVIIAIIQSNPYDMEEIYSSCAPALLNRFKERDENVQIDIINCFKSFFLVSDSKRLSQTNNFEGSLSKALVLSSRLLHGKKSSSVKVSALQLMSIISSQFWAIFKNYLENLLVEILSFLQSKDQSLKLESLIFLRNFCESNKENFDPSFLKNIIPLVFDCIKEDKWFKINLEALKLLYAFLPLLRPKFDGIVRSPLSLDDLSYDNFIRTSYDAVYSRLQVHEADQHIKDWAIHTLSLIFNYFGDFIPEKLESFFDNLTKRLDSEPTRLSSLKALIFLYQDPVIKDVSRFVPHILLKVSSFLQLNNRIVKVVSLEAILAIYRYASEDSKGRLFLSFAHFIPDLINFGQSDLYIMQLTLKLLILATRLSNIDINQLFMESMYQNILQLCYSSHMQGPALNSLIELFQAVSDSSAFGLTNSDLFKDLCSLKDHPNFNEATKISLLNASKVFSVVILSNSSDRLKELIGSLTADLNSQNEKIRQLSLYVIGEVGQATDLTFVPSIAEKLFHCFDSSNEDTKLAASYSLGHTAIGNLAFYLPMIISQTTSNDSKQNQYLLLNSIREIIIVDANLNKEGISDYLEEILELLLKFVSSKDESVRSIVAECLGELLNTTVYDKVASLLKSRHEDSSQDSLSKRLIANTLRFYVNRSKTSLVSDETKHRVIRGLISTALLLLNDEDLDVKKSILVMVNAAVFQNIQLVEDFIPSIIVPKLVETLKVKIVKKYNLGPFKHEIDENLPLRKISLSCLENILSQRPDLFDFPSFLDTASVLLADDDEIKQLTFQILSKLSTIQAVSTLIPPYVEAFLTPMKNFLTKKLEISSKSEDKISSDRAVELIKNGLRTILALNKIESLKQNNKPWNDFFDKLTTDQNFSSYFFYIENENLYGNKIA